MSAVFLSADEYLNNVESLLGDSEAVDIAVAFWGQGAESLIPQTGKRLRIICNLGMGGTNPDVIRTLQTYPSVEIKNLNRLHAKVMIGDLQAIIGSANCSTNGLNFEGDELVGWHEAGYRITAQDQLIQMRAWFKERWADGETITDQMLNDAAEAWLKRSKVRGVRPSSSRQLLKMSLDTLSRRDAAVLIWRDPMSGEAEQRLEEKKDSVGNAAITNDWGGYEDWFKDLYPGLTVLDIQIDAEGAVEIHGLVEIIDETRYMRVDSDEEMSLHICRPLKSFLGIPKAELLKGVKAHLKKHWRDLFADEHGDVAQVLPLPEFVKALRSV